MTDNKELNLIQSKITDLEDILNQLLDTYQLYTGVAYKLNPEEYQYILKHLNGRCCINCTNGSCTVPSYEKDGLDEFGKPLGSECIGWNNPRLIGRAKILQKYNITMF